MCGMSTRIGAYKCYQCRKPFTVKIGTIFESS
jgi:transposase-like protein